MTIKVNNGWIITHRAKKFQELLKNEINKDIGKGYIVSHFYINY